MKTLILCLSILMHIVPSATQAKSHVVSISSVLPGESNSIRQLVGVEEVPAALYETIGFRELDDFTYYVAKLQARANVLASLLPTMSEMAADPTLDPELYAHIGDGFVQYGNEAIHDSELLLTLGERVSKTTDDFCKKKPWKCHKVFGQAKDNIAAVNKAQSEIRSAISQAKEIIASRNEEWTPPDERTDAEAPAR